MHKYKQHVRPRDHDRLRRRPAEDMLGDIIQKIFADRTGPILIAVGGPGGTGKSWFSGKLARRLGDASVLRLDDYKTARTDRQQAGIFGPHPDANKMELIAEHLEDIRDNRSISKPVYDPAAGDAELSETYLPARFNLIDGEVSTYRRFRDLADFAVFIDSDWRTQLATRLERDLTDRDYSPEKAVATFLHSNLREFGEHGAESKNWADVHLFCHEDYRLELESVSRELYAQVRDLLHDDVEEVGLDGPIVPLLTPFAEDGSIDRRAFAEHLDWLAERGAKRVLTGDVTGELFSLTQAERLELLKLALEYFPGLVFFQAGGGPLGETIALAGQAQRLGADAICCMTPIGWPDAPSQGVVEYLRRIADSLDVPLMLRRSGQDQMTDETISAIGRFALTHWQGAVDPNSNTAAVAGERTCDIPLLKRMVRSEIEAYPIVVRPPLFSGA